MIQLILFEKGSMGFERHSSIQSLELVFLRKRWFTDLGTSQYGTVHKMGQFVSFSINKVWKLVTQF